MKGIQVCSIVGPRPSQRVDNWEIIKINWQLLKSSPEPLGQYQPNLAQSILGRRGFKFVQMKGHTLLKGEIIGKFLKSLPFYSVLEFCIRRYRIFHGYWVCHKSMLQISWISSSFFIMRHCCSGEQCGPWSSLIFIQTSEHWQLIFYLQVAKNCENLWNKDACVLNKIKLENH